MTKTCRKPILVILLTLCLATLCGVMLACGNDTPTDTTAAYSVTIKTAEGDPAVGVDVKVKKGSASFGTTATDANGRATFALAEGSYTVELSKLPAGYELPEGALTLTAEAPDLTVTLVKSFAYTVKLVQADGTTPFYAAGVQVGICLEGNCLSPTALPESGIVSIVADKNDYHAKIFNLPAGYEYDRDADDYYTGGALSATVTEITIPVYQVHSVDLSGAAMTAAEKAEFAAKSAAYNAQAQRYVAHKYTQSLAAGEIAYFSITPDMDGYYYIYKADSDDMLYLLNGNTFASGETGNVLASLPLEAGKTYYFKGINKGNGAATAEVVIASPYSSYVTYNGVGGTVELTVGSANTNAVLAFQATAAGTYKAEVQGTALAHIENVDSFSDEFIETALGDDQYTANAICTDVEIAPKQATQSVPTYFTVAVKADSYPVTVSVKLTKTADSDYTYTYVEVEETLSQYADAPEGKELTYIPMSEDTSLVLGSDNLYHLGTADGPVVLVNITGELESNRFEAGGALAYFEMVNTRLAAYAFTDPDNAKNTLDYTKFLRGFEEYSYDRFGNLVVPDPEDITTETYYAKYVNEDGVYPLTQELKDFLEMFFAANEESFLWQVPIDAAIGYEWMFPLCYYGEATEADQIVGEYGFVSNEEYQVGDPTSVWDEETQEYVPGDPIDAGYMTLVIGKNNTYAIYDKDYGEVEIGTWSKNEDGTYTFGFSDFLGEVSYTVTYDDTDKKVTFTTLDFDGETVITVYVFQLRDAE